jgi:hypothetical protein
VGRITIVYYGFLAPRKRWPHTVVGQLGQLRSTGLLEAADLHVHLTGDGPDVAMARSWIRDIAPTAMIHASSENRFEYPGISLIWRLATERPQRIYLYFHSKGVASRGWIFGRGSRRTPEERRIYQAVIVPWRRILGIFDADPTVNKVGLCASEAGWMWFNFWWARGSYLASCEEPIVTTRRHYYEDWLHRTTEGPRTAQDCYSLAGNRKGIFYAPRDACRIVNHLPLTS